MAELPRIHQESIVIAAHTDLVASDVFYWRMGGQTAVMEKRHVPTLRAGGITVIGEHLGGDTRYAYVPASNLHTTPAERAMRLIDYAHLEAEESESILLVRTVDDIYRAKRENKIGMIICFEGAAFLQDEVAYLRNYYRLGLRMLGITHNFRNSLADGCLEVAGGGLSHFGREVVEECNRLGILVDVSHLSDRGIEDVLKHSTQPITASHSNARALCPTSRNHLDEHLKGIAQGGGVIGVHAMNSLVSPKPQPTIDDILQHVVHMVELGGIDCVGLGPDLMENWEQDKLEVVNEGALKFNSVPYKPSPWEYPTGYQSLADTPNLTEGLIKLGFSDEDLRKFLGGNFLRLFEKVWR